MVTGRNSAQITKPSAVQQSIPDKYLGLIWEALTTVPQQTKLRETLQTTLIEAPTEEEFLRAIKEIKKSTTPGNVQRLVRQPKGLARGASDSLLPLVKTDVATGTYTSAVERKMSGSTS